MELQTDLGKWNLDEACLMAGRRIENALNKNEDPFASLTLPSPEGRGGAYRSAAGRVKKKVKVKNGIW